MFVHGKARSSAKSIVQAAESMHYGVEGGTVECTLFARERRALTPCRLLSSLDAKARTAQQPDLSFLGSPSRLDFRIVFFLWSLLGCSSTKTESAAGKIESSFRSLLGKVAKHSDFEDSQLFRFFKENFPDLEGKMRYGAGGAVEGVP